jgi:hypothetical protein
VIEVINGGNHSTDSENTNSDRRAIHIHGWMEHNLAGYANTTPMDAQKYQEVMNSQGKLI